MHIICCIRARQKMDFRNPSKPVDLGIQPITEKNFMFEMTASMMMWDEGKSQQFLKMPEALRSIFGNGSGYIGPEAGRALVAWVNSGDQTDIDLEKYKSQMQMAASGGVEALKKEWVTMPRDIIKRMKSFYSQFEESAKAFDESKEKPEEKDFQSKGSFNPAQTLQRETVVQSEPDLVEQPSDPNEVF